MLCLTVSHWLHIKWGPLRHKPTVHRSCLGYINNAARCLLITIGKREYCVSFCYTSWSRACGAYLQNESPQPGDTHLKAFGVVSSGCAFSPVIDTPALLVRGTKHTYRQTDIKCVTRLRIQTHTNRDHTYITIYSHIYTYINSHTYVDTHMYTHTFTFICTCIHTNTRVHACTHTYSYIHKHTHSHTRSPIFYQLLLPVFGNISQLSLCKRLSEESSYLMEAFSVPSK
jgi:hypothetical protein